MAVNLTLPWADEFRRLLALDLTNKETINRFLHYCYQQEAEISKIWTAIEAKGYKDLSLEEYKKVLK